MSGEAVNVFISYARADARELAVRLRDDLLATGHSVWLDLSDIPGGSNWAKKIEDAIEHCHITLALLSPGAYDSQWCRAEQLRAIRKGKRVIPVLVVTGSDVPLHLEHMNYVDFTEPARYDATFRDLLSDIRAGSAFALPDSNREASSTSPFRKARPRPRAGYRDEKRSAPSFRRHIQELKREKWLGARFWWTSFLFHFTDMEQLAQILQADELVPTVGQGGGGRRTRFDQQVRLYFRPRTPDLYHAEGFRPAAQAAGRSTPIPVYLLFDMEAVICHPESVFSDGDPTRTGKTYKTPAYFHDLPFEQIYHDSWFLPEEREEIMRCREAQVLVPQRLGLESLEVIWVRSPAEYETLHQLLAPELWQKWRDKVTARADYHLFNNHRPYVHQVALQADQIRLRFNPSQRSGAEEQFDAVAVVQFDDGSSLRWQESAFVPQKDLVLRVPQTGNYTLHFTLDGQTAYAGTFTSATQVR